LGLVHQDVKPGNVLMTEDGIAKVADFGLSRARARAESGRTVVPLATDGMWTPAAGGSVLVSSGGMTPAYCSPEQAEGKRLSRRTDQWSWAVSVLEMFTGEVTWGYGIAARDALEDYASTGGGRLPLPASMADALRRCLEWSPESRYETMLDAACQLSRVHELGTGRTYARLPPRAMPRDEWVQGRLERRTIYMGTWRHPREWIEKALAEAGRSPAEAESLLPDYSGSRQAQAVADLLAYETAHQLLRTLSTRGRDLEAVLAELCTEKGMVHQKLEDLPGARAMHDQAVALLERLVTVEGRTELCHRLADARYHQAWSHIYPRPSPVAVPAADRAIGLLTELVSRNPDGDLAAGLVGARSARCLALVLQGRRGDAISEFAETISWAERVFAARPSDKLAGALAGACSLSAMAGLLAGQGAAAVDPLRRAIGLLRHLVYDLGQREFLLYLAEAYQNYGVWLRSQGQLDEALESTRWSVEVCERLVRDEGRGDLAVSLPVAYLGLALVHWLRGNAADARQATARAAEAFRQVVYLRGRTDQLTGFGILLSQAGDAASKAGDREGAVREYRRAIQILHRQPRGQLVLAQTHQACAQVLWELAQHSEARGHAARAAEAWEKLIAGGHTQRGADLAYAQGTYALLALKCGDTTGAAQFARQAIPALRAEVARTGRADLRQLLDALTTHFGRQA
jgi:tetratricopeptide (TPR) repeat protein